MPTDTANLIGGFLYTNIYIMIYLEHTKIFINIKKVNYITIEDKTEWCDGAYILHFNRNIIRVELQDRDALISCNLIH